ncbi:MAG TPA: DUF2232 domain-containing protein [Candidatus Handelsmanbacteria bacterium]|nr:DUF2232 domain-containing protein [Candidatus Handelsmanbacteria bacterium]
MMACCAICSQASMVILFTCPSWSPITSSKKPSPDPPAGPEIGIAAVPVATATTADPGTEMIVRRERHPLRARRPKHQPPPLSGSLKTPDRHAPMLILLGIALMSFSLLMGLRYGSRGALPLVGLLCLGAAFLLGPAFGLAPIMGLIAVLRMEQKESYGRVLAMACTPAVGFSLWQLVQARDPVHRAERTTTVLEQFQALGLDLEDGGQALHAMVDAVLRVQPSIELLTLLLTFVLAYRLSQTIAPRFELELPAPVPLPLWRPWDELIWVLIAALGLGLFGSGLMADLALNLMVVTGVLYGAQGLAVLRFFAQRKGVPLLVELSFYLGLLLVAGLAFLLLAGLGLLDTWFDWRRLRPASSEEEEA